MFLGDTDIPGQPDLDNYCINSFNSHQSLRRWTPFSSDLYFIDEDSEAARKTRF